MAYILKIGIYIKGMLEVQMDLPNVKTVGFALDQEQMNKLTKTIDRIQRQAPSDASFKVTLSNQNDRYEGQFVILSLVGAFGTYSRSPVFEVLLQTVEKQLLDQINVWKQTRFDGRTKLVV